MTICCYGASSDLIDKFFLDQGYELGKKMAQRGHSLVFGGGATGMMGATARGVHSIGNKVTGVAPTFFDQEGVIYKECDEFIWTETMRQRKQKMQDLSDAFIVTPGGIGTFEEFFEMITLKSLGQLEKPIVVFNISGYYDEVWDVMDRATEMNFMYVTTDQIYKVFTDIDEMLDYLEENA